LPSESVIELGRGVGVTGAEEGGGDGSVVGGTAAIVLRRVPESSSLPVGAFAGVLTTGSTR
jgi:hypothetical protein